MKIFLDVGAHTGETVKATLDSRYGFDRIICFEPVESSAERIARFQDSRVEVHPFGLWKEECELPVFGPGALGASIFADKDDGGPEEVCRFVRASDWIRENIREEDSVFMKLNCEGSECDILDDLIDQGAIHRIDFLMIDFDVRKIPSQAHREEEVLARLRSLDSPRYHLAQDVMTGPTHTARIQNWLDLVGAGPPRHPLKVIVLRSIDRTLAARRIVEALLPERAYNQLRGAWRYVRSRFLQ